MGKKTKIKLSQCMIVKNEEENIRRALSWAKHIAFEQIVVDTGSTDRTVEIAEQMGAKVYQFQWCDDFSAAKNHAIDQASGDWIAFLDADEYFTEKDTEKLANILDQAEKRKGMEMPHFIRCAWIQMGDDGKPFSVSVQDRIFRNTPEIRYHGKIHEQIGLPGGEPMVCQDEQKTLSIFHTGYASSVMNARGTWQRNIELLKQEIRENPKNYSAWSYLGDAYAGLGENQEAKNAYLKAMEGKPDVTVSRWGYMNAGKSLLKLFMNHPFLAESEREAEEVAEKTGYPATDNPDVYFFLGLYYLKRNDLKRAYQEIKEALKRLEAYKGDDVIYLNGNLEKTYVWMAGFCQQLKLPDEELFYGICALRMNRRLEKVACEVLRLMKKEEQQGKGTEDSWEVLKRVYDLQDIRDLLFLFKCARITGYSALEGRILKYIPEDVRKKLGG